MEEEKRRYVGIDLGKREYTMAIIGKNGKVVIHHGKTSIESRVALYRLLEKDDRIAIEAGNLAFIIAYEIKKIVGSEVRVLNSAKLPFIWDAPTKTDKEDAIKLAKLVEERRDEKLPIVPLPSEKDMERRETISNYGREVQNRTRLINNLHSLFVKQGITTIVKKDLATAGQREEAVKVLTGQEREDAEWQLKYLEMFEKRIKIIKDKIKKEAKTDALMLLLQTIPGVGPIVAYAFVAYVGDGSRFSKGAQVSNYIGFVPRLYISGTICRNGHITKRGNGYLRGLLVQAAWAAVFSQYGGALRDRYIIRTKQGYSKKKTIVGIARRLVELMYAIMTSKTEYEVRPYKGPALITVSELAAQALGVENEKAGTVAEAHEEAEEKGPAKGKEKKSDTVKKETLPETQEKKGRKKLALPVKKEKAGGGKTKGSKVGSANKVT